MTSVVKIKGTDTFYRWIYVLLVGVVVLDPTNTILHLKDPLFVLFMTSIFFTPPVMNRNILFFLFIFLFVVVYGFLIGQLIADDIEPVYFSSFFKSSLFIFIVLPLLNLNSDLLLKTHIRVSVFIPLIILGIYASYVYSPELFGRIYQFFLEKNNTVTISQRNYLGVTFIALFYKTIPICFFSLIYYLRNSGTKRNKFLVLLFFLSIYFSGSRTPMLCGVAILLAVLFTSHSAKYRYLKWMVSFGILITFCSFVFLLINEKGEPSRDLKVSAMQDYGNVFFDKMNLFTGTGVGSTFYLTGRDEYTPHTELTYFEIVRMFGAVMGGMMILLVFLPCLGYFVTSDRNYKDFFIAYFFYMIMVATNPLLFSSTGMYVFSLGLVFFMRVQNERKKTGYSLSHL